MFRRKLPFSNAFNFRLWRGRHCIATLVIDDIIACKFGFSERSSRSYSPMTLPLHHVYLYRMNLCMRCIRGAWIRRSASHHHAGGSSILAVSHSPYLSTKRNIIQSLYGHGIEKWWPYAFTRILSQLGLISASRSIRMVFDGLLVRVRAI